MIRIAKFLFTVWLGFFIHARMAENSGTTHHQRRSKSSIEEVKAGRAPQKNAKRPKSLFDSPEPPPRKEVVLFPKPGQVLTENQVSFDTPEGKAEFQKNIGWLTDICDRYALEQWKKFEESKVAKQKKQGSRQELATLEKKDAEVRSWKVDGVEVRCALRP